MFVFAIILLMILTLPPAFFFYTRSASVSLFFACWTGSGYTGQWCLQLPEAQLASLWPKVSLWKLPQGLCSSLLTNALGLDPNIRSLRWYPNTHFEIQIIGSPCPSPWMMSHHWYSTRQFVSSSLRRYELTVICTSTHSVTFRPSPCCWTFRTWPNRIFVINWGQSENAQTPAIISFREQYSKSVTLLHSCLYNSF